MPKFEIRKNPEENPLYENKDHYIEIVEGRFTGVHFTFGQIEFLGEDEEGNGNISFDYDLLFVPEHVNLLEEKQSIEADVAIVLQDILENMLSEEANETGNSDSEQSTEG